MERHLPEQLEPLRGCGRIARRGLVEHELRDE
jgi:hypothetical protein